ncbi:unnamed protein product [Thelazia callipaeda]|uniref:Ig-like domain-containing protein n=1 Tax=Thelazia callipaeda TaxID=103827 RepID=A0A0N5CZA3_THECL|nr:unnamed protein product [Thelazia callipaeda]
MLMSIAGYFAMIKCSLLIALIALMSRKQLTCCMSSTQKSFVQPKVTSFWITVEPISVELTEGCLAAAGCADSRLTLFQWNLISDERIASSWSIHEYFVLILFIFWDSSHSFVSYWNKGRPADVTFNYEIVGTDPIYGFARTCDSTQAIRIFDVKQNFSTHLIKNEIITSMMHSVPQPEKVTLNLTGRCFTAMISVQKYESTCPWCSCNEQYAIIGQLSESDTREFPYLLNSTSDALVDVGLIVLSAIAFATSAAFSCLLIAYLRERRGNFSKNITKRNTRCCSKCNSKDFRGHQHLSMQKTRLMNNEIVR